MQNVNHRNIPVSILRVRFLNTTIFSVYVEKCYLPPIFQCYSFPLLYYPYSHFWGRTRMHVQRRVRRWEKTGTKWGKIRINWPIWIYKIMTCHIFRAIVLSSMSGRYLSSAFVRLFREQRIVFERESDEQGLMTNIFL